MISDPPPNLPIYPIPLGKMLNGSWFQFDFRLLNQSAWRSKIDPEAGFYGHILWSEAAAQDTAGTLPDDDVELARLAGFGRDVEGWRRIRALGALSGWEECLCVSDDGEWVVRLCHPQLTRAIVKAVDGVETARDGTLAAKDRKDLERVRKQMAWLGMPSQLVANYEVQREVLNWLRGNSFQIRRERVREALVFHGFADVIGAEVSDLDEERRRRTRR